MIEREGKPEIYCIDHGASNHLSTETALNSCVTVRYCICQVHLIRWVMFYLQLTLLVLFGSVTIVATATRVVVDHDFQHAHHCSVCIQEVKVTKQSCKDIGFDQEVVLSSTARPALLTVLCEQTDHNSARFIYSGSLELPPTVTEEAHTEQDCEETCSIDKHREKLAAAFESGPSPVAGSSTPIVVRLSTLISERRVLTPTSLQDHEKEVLDIVHPKLR